jgi:hypothetical protein
VTAYFSGGSAALPSTATERYVRDILARVRERSGGHVRGSLRLAPTTDDERDEAERRAASSWCSTSTSRTTRSAWWRATEAWSSSTSAEREVIPVIQPDTRGPRVRDHHHDQASSPARTGRDRPALSGHEGRPRPQGLSGAASACCRATTIIREVSATEAIDDGAPGALLIVEPHHRDRRRRSSVNIDQFVMHGGSLGVFGGQR